MNPKYLFKSARLGFRNWQGNDVSKMIAINQDDAVMEFFPAKPTPEQTTYFIARMQQMYVEKKHCYFAVEELETGVFIGFIGLAEQTYEAPFTPCVDIGWRLDKAYWGKGFATEGAKQCLQYAVESLKLPHVKAIAPMINVKSIRIMEKIGMQKELTFKHPRLQNNKRLQECICYNFSFKYSAV